MSQEELGAVEGAVAVFHQRQAGGQDADVYREAAQDFRGASSLSDFTRLNDAVRRAAAGCEPPQRNPSAWNVNRSTSGHFITVSYQRTCPSGPLAEQFTFRMDGGTPRLAGYHISGMALFPPAPAAPATPAAQESPPAPDAPAAPATPAQAAAQPT
jgi:hypothetical protein